jgi:nucleoside-diphosphate-sugar epimerase
VTVLVSGGTGLVGSHVIEALRDRGEDVRALVRAESRAAVESLGAEAIVGDVTDRAAWMQAAAGARGIVHAAAFVAQRATLDQFMEVNVGGTRFAIEAARNLGIRLVHISSVAVYGRMAVDREDAREVDEEFPFAPLSHRDYYARSKRAAEALVYEAASRGDVSAAAIRPDVIYGERDRLFTPKLLAALRLPLVPLIGDGSNHLACVYAGNVATAILAALDARQSGFRAYNVTHDAAPLLTCREFLRSFETAAGVSVRAVRVPRMLARMGVAAWSAWQRVTGVGRYAGLGRAAVAFLGGENPYVAERITRELGWRPAWDTRAAIERTVRRARDARRNDQKRNAREHARASL